ncbi:cytochrome-c oxidase, cbb3-type subunit III [Shewanella intestini]|uniref:Cbb3-type cytochrome c oxidase subunit n=1 Tax=Shewanella intestini TaxID=2017544 RepID=A0ABS5HZR5_9GAMM|nr:MULTISPECIES: cytochrome-c oxidase, cbb3-type subunit III [Shewanella]MBR9727275.1 cytochrome-c oxidase, cbb3-type subunit III [Shewanella intestini]MRG36077.1 cytochrome-c oxidase, cbb3-type subunit III [Shewanella sp. XMDDZSB0408]
MSNFWNIWIIVPTLLVIFGCVFILIACSKNNTGIDEGKSMGHSFDGIEELNNPLPKWWSYMFYVTIVFGLIYLALYPGLGSYKGLFGWTSSNQSVVSNEDSKAAVEAAKAEDRLSQYDREVAKADAKYKPIFAAYLATPLEELVKDKEALKVGGRLFLQNCSQCHGSDARGSIGFPNLADGNWLYGGELADIKKSIMDGRNGMMPPKGGLPIDDSELKGLTEYVVKLSGREHDAALAAQGQGSYMKGCFACHGMDGSGNKFMGAPNLTDGAWLYGSHRDDIEASIKNGRTGMMPAWKEILGEEKVHVISAYVYSLSNK